MKVTEKYCNVSIHMHNGQAFASWMYTTITINGQEKQYHKDLTKEQAARVMYKLAKATGKKPEIEYNLFNSKLTTKTISYLWEA